MDKKENRICLQAIIRRYRRASCANKGVILDRFCSVCGYNRKYAVRVLNHPPSSSSKWHIGRKPVYRGYVFLTALKHIFQLVEVTSKVRQRIWPFGDLFQ